MKTAEGDQSAPRVSHPCRAEVEANDARSIPPMPSVTSRQRDDLYYSLLVGAAKTRLLESMFDLRLAHVLAERGPLTAIEIAETLRLHPKRTAKWLVLLERVGLVQNHQGKYQNTGEAVAIHWDKDQENFFTRDMMEYCRRVNSLDFLEVLRGAPLPEAVRWPPRTKEAAQHLELWMAVTAHEAVSALEGGTDWSEVVTMLDVGGGDGSVACTLARKFGHLRPTVFNLPASAELARARIAREKLEARVQVVEGDFIEGALPTSFDRVQFSRVLADWAPPVCQMLLKKARAALKPGGSLVIAEPFDDTNRDLAISWEFRYAFYDDFGVQTYKSVAQYQEMLRNAGFSQFQVVDRVNDSLYGVITAR